MAQGAEPFWLKQGHLAGAGGPVCFSVVVFRHVGSWAGTANGFSRTASRTPCGRLFCEGLVHPRSGEMAAAHPTKDRKDLKKDTKAKDSAQVQQKASAPKIVPIQPRSNRQSPPEVHAAAQAKVRRLQAAISALGDVDMIEKENLERALVRAQSQAVVPPVSAQIISTKGFIEREKKRLVAAEEAVIAAVQYRDECLEAFGTGRETFGRIAVAGEEPFHRSRGRRI